MSFRLLIPCRFDNLNRDVVCETCPIGYEVCDFESLIYFLTIIYFRVVCVKNVLADIHANCQILTILFVNLKVLQFNVLLCFRNKKNVFNSSRKMQ